MVVTVNVDEKRIKEIQNQLGAMGGRAPQAISRSMNRAIAALDVEANKGIRKKYHVKAGDVKSATTRKKSSPSKLSATVEMAGSPMGLDKFKVSPKTINPKRKSQLKISVRKDRGAKTIGGAFNANIAGIKVMKRTGKNGYPLSVYSVLLFLRWLKMKRFHWRQDDAAELCLKKGFAMKLEGC